MRKLVSTVLLIVAGVAVFAACGSDPTPTPSPTPTTTAEPTPMAQWEIEWNEVLEAARQEGEVSVWVSGGGQAAVDHLKNAFEDAYPGIEVDLFQAASGSERDTRFLEEWQAGIATVDIFNGGSSGGDGRLKPAGALQPVRPFFILPEVTDQELWAGGEWQFVDIERQYMLMGGAASTPSLALADSVDPGTFVTWDDLLKSEFHGKIIMNDPRTSGNGAARGGFWFCAPDPRCFEPVMRDFMERFFRESGVVLSDDDRANLDQIVNGEMLVLVSPAQDELPQLEEINALPTLVEVLEAPDGNTYYQTSDSAGIVYVPNYDIPHPNAATVYLNWFYSQEGGQALVERRLQPSTRRDVDQSSIPDYIVPGEPGYSANQTIRMLNVEGGIREKVNEWLP